MSAFLFISLFLFQAAAPDSLPGEAALLEEGLALEAEQKYEQALAVWGSGPGTLEVPSLAIGRAYIRLATEHSLREHYETASAMYGWGLTAQETQPNASALNEELAMLKPLFSSLRFNNEQYKAWVELLDKENTEVYRHLRTFWEELDPTPGTRYNERLVEHWERIAYAREHFDRNDQPPYGTDDRGPVYVSYGEPDRRQSGNLRLARGEVYSECKSMNPDPIIATHCNFDFMPDVVMSLDPNPYYEIWIYDKPDPAMQYNLVMIFGDNAEAGFGQVEKVEDFIPNRAFTLNEDRFEISNWAGKKTTPGAKFTPGMMMMWMYYQQLAGIDFFFSNRFDQIAFEWNNADPRDPRIGKYQGPVQTEKTRTITLDDLQKAPPEQSTYTKAFPEIPLAAHHYRVLDEAGCPAVWTFLESWPGEVFLMDLTANQEVFFPEDTALSEQALGYYELLHGLKATAGGRLISQSREPAGLILDLSGSTPSSSVFKIPLVEGQQELILYAELHNRHPGTRPLREDTPFPATLRGLGTMETELPEPLSTDSSALEMADLVLGYQMEAAPEANIVFPFVVANDRNIPQSEELAVHLEVYHLQPGPEGLAEFTMEYEIYQPRRLGWLRGPAREVSLSFTQQVRGSRHVQNLSILTRELEPGEYTLRFTVTDTHSGQQLQKELKFAITEGGEELSLNAGE